MVLILEVHDFQLQRSSKDICHDCACAGLCRRRDPCIVRHDDAAWPSLGDAVSRILSDFIGADNPEAEKTYGMSVVQLLKWSETLGFLPRQGSGLCEDGMYGIAFAQGNAFRLSFGFLCDLFRRLQKDVQRSALQLDFRLNCPSESPGTVRQCFDLCAKAGYMSKQLDWTTGTACPDEASETYWMQTPMLHQADTGCLGCILQAK